MAKASISICIPAFNRPSQLGQLLNSIKDQEFHELEVIIAEDASSERVAIRRVVEGYIERSSAKINYVENERNLGYDGNLRQLVSLAEGDYCLFMGNDDLLCPSALEQVCGALEQFSDIGVILRSYRSFVGTPDRVQQEFKYFSDMRFFPPGDDAVVTFFRRSVVISGLTLHRESALRLATDRYDGTLLYQVYLISNILAKRPGLYLPTPLALVRMDGRPDFGSSQVESEQHTPGCRTPESSLHFVRGMLLIAADLNAFSARTLYKRIFKDLGNYSYPLLSYQRSLPPGRFCQYALSLLKLGFWQTPLFWCYWLLLLFLGKNISDKLITYVKRTLSVTPKLGRVYSGQSISTRVPKSM